MKKENKQCQLFLPKKQERFTISKADEILLYGYNEYCKQQVDRLLQKEYSVIGIIDQNAENIAEEYRGVRIVRSISELDVSDRCILFIMLQNGMSHWDIAFDLYKYGIKRIVFCPMRNDYQNDIFLEFILQYNYMISGDYTIMKVPYLSDWMFERSAQSPYRISQILDNGEYIVWLPVDMIRTTMKEGKYRDLPITEFTPYINLFLFLDGREDIDISEYIRLYGKTPYPVESVEAYQNTINKRKSLYYYFEKNYREGNMKYFEVAAPKVVFNENGYVNLCEGQHRCVYLLSKGMKKIPVRVTQDILERISKYGLHT